MLLHIDGEVVEIRPGEQFKSKKEVESRFLELLNQPKPKGRKKQVLDVSSSPESRS
jgi:hypothetical protein